MVKKYLFKLVDRIYRIPFIKRTFHTVVAIEGVREAGQAYITAFNASAPLHHRAVAFTRGSCCTAALVTSYMSRRFPDPVISARFKMCCYAFSALYGATGGETALTLSLMGSSNKTCPAK